MKDEIVDTDLFDSLLPYFAAINSETNNVSLILSKQFRLDAHKINSVFKKCKITEFPKVIWIEGRLNSAIVNYLYNAQLNRWFGSDNSYDEFPYLINCEVNLETKCFRNNAIIFPEK